MDIDLVRLADRKAAKAMTCYLRVHEVMAGVPKADREIDWDLVVKSWQQAQSVADRETALSAMHLEPIDIYDLPNADLSRYCGLILAGRVDQEFLYRHREIIRRFLDHGNVLVFSGELFRTWLPNSRPIIPCDRNKPDKATVDFAPHPVFDGVDADSLGHYFVSGHHPVPRGAEVVAALPEGGAVIYVDKVSTSGTIMVHAGHTLLGYAADVSTEKTARRMIPQMLTWIRQEGGG